MMGRDMHDADVRRALESLLKAEMAGTGALLLHEMALRRGATRADMAVVGSEIHGYEIKSKTDTLKLLPKQVELYGAVMDRVTLVAAEKHLAKALKIIPLWWGVSVAELLGEGPDVTIRPERPADVNPRLDPSALADFLWRDEMVEALMEIRGQAKRSAVRGNVESLSDQLVREVSTEGIRMIVRRALRRRANWHGEIIAPKAPPQTSRRFQRAAENRRRQMLLRFPAFHGGAPSK